MPSYWVLSEPTSYGASADSFFEDFRHGLDCRNGMISNDDSYIVWKELNKQRLQAARSAGALTFDLASAIDPLTNGRDGGTYMYDQMHYTPEGSHEVARLIRPVLLDILVKIEGQR